MTIPKDWTLGRARGPREEVLPPPTPCLEAPLQAAPGRGLSRAGTEPGGTAWSWGGYSIYKALQEEREAAETDRYRDAKISQCKFLLETFLGGTTGREGVRKERKQAAEGS